MEMVTTPLRPSRSPRDRARRVALGLLFVSLAALGLWVGASLWIKRGVEEPPFAVLAREGDVELRRYEPTVVAATVVEGSRDEALNEAFRRLAGYIFGQNQGRAKLAMTAPVSASEPETIAMTAPVAATAMEGGRYRVTFTMPRGYTVETLPVPNDARVRLELEPARDVAAVRFSGYARSAAIEEHTATLLAWAKASGRALGAPTLAQYDPPFAMPLMRRNEILATLR
jgi:hypothetical protein